MKRRSPTRLLRVVALLLMQAFAVAFGVVVITFCLIHFIPGDPARHLLGPQAPESAVAALREELGLNEPLATQFVDYIGGVLQGDLGSSLASQQPVAELLFAGLGVTLVLVSLTVVTSVILGFSLGLAAAVTRRKSLDRVVRLGAIALLATPSFVVGIVMILLIAVRAGLAPAGGWGDGYPDNLRYLWMPTLALSCFLTPAIARVVRQRAKSVLNEQFIDAAIARGIPMSRLTLRHVMPNSALPVITLIGLSFGGLIGGAVIVEAVFGLPGIGEKILRAVASRDYPVVQGAALLTGLVVVVSNTIAEIVVRVVDPRTRP